MDKALGEWTLIYVRNRDLTFRKLVKHEEHLTKGYIDFHFKDKIQTYIIIDRIDNSLFDTIKEHDTNVAVCLNIEDNFKFLIKNWKKFSEIKNLSFIFVNLKLNERWVINPHTHSMVADPKSIETGLKTMFDTANGNVAEMKGSKKKLSMFEESSTSNDEGEEE